jgi:hypothetical protein
MKAISVLKILVAGKLRAASKASSNPRNSTIKSDECAGGLFLGTLRG